MKIQIYADGSDLSEMIKTYRDSKWVTGFTTNPTLMRKAKVENYVEFIQGVTDVIKDLSVSFEVFADDLPEMERQARILASYGNNVSVKIPVTNTKGESTKTLIKTLINDGISVNVTAVFTKDQIDELIPYMSSGTSVILSIFAGRIADTGVDPTPIIKYALEKTSSNVKVLWASCREVYNIYEADRAGCHIVTVSPDLIAKLSLQDKCLTQYSLDTVQMFYDDAARSKYVL